MTTLKLLAISMCSPFAVLVGVIGVALLGIAGRNNDPLKDLPRGARVYDKATGEYITREEAIQRCYQRRTK